MALIPYADEGGLGEEGREAIQSFAEQHKRPAMLRMMMAHYPPLLEAMDVMYKNLIRRPGSLDHRTKELIFVTASKARECNYCSGGHSRLLVNEFGMTSEAVCEIRSNPLEAAENPRQAAILEFARKVATDADGVGPSDIQALRDHGIDDETVVELLAAVMVSAFTNTIAKTLNVEEDLDRFGLADEYF